MKFLVTGANGFIGQGVVRELLEQGYEVVATDISTTAVDSRAIRISEDIFNLLHHEELFQNIDVLIHLAWKNGFIHNSDNHVEDLPKHFNFIRRAIGAGVKHIAVLGTMHEIGFFEGSVDEKTPTHPANLYGIAKDALRNMTKLVCFENDVTWQWIRGFYIVDNTGSGSSIFAKITNAERQGDRTFPFTKGLNQYDFIDYNTFCKQIVAICSQNKINGIINASSGYPQTLASRVEKFIEENNYKIKLEYGVFPDRIYDSKAIWGNSDKIEEILKNECKEYH